jgi:hypothetical protein
MLDSIAKLLRQPGDVITMHLSQLTEDQFALNIVQALSNVKSEYLAPITVTGSLEAIGEALSENLASFASERDSILGQLQLALATQKAVAAAATPKPATKAAQATKPAKSAPAPTNPVKSTTAPNAPMASNTQDPPSNIDLFDAAEEPEAAAVSEPATENPAITALQIQLAEVKHYLEQLAVTCNVASAFEGDSVNPMFAQTAHAKRYLELQTAIAALHAA